MPQAHHAIVTETDQVTAQVAHLIQAHATDGRPVVVLHPGAIEATEVTLSLQEQGHDSLLHDGGVELVHRSAGTEEIRAAATRVAELVQTAPRLVTIHPVGSINPIDQHRAGCFDLLELAEWDACTCVFGFDHATTAGLSTLLRHARLSIDDIDVDIDRAEGRLLLVDLLLHHLDRAATVRQLALAPALVSLDRRALDTLVSRRLQILDQAAPPTVATTQRQRDNSPRSRQNDLCQVACAEIAETDGQLNQLLDALQTSIGTELLLEDADFHPLAWSSPMDQQPASLAHMITPQRLTRLIGQLRPGLPERVRLGTPSAGHRLVMRVGSKKPLGYLSATSPRRDDAATSNWLQHATPVLAAALSRHQAHSRLRAETRHQLVTMLAHGMLSPPSAQLAVEELVGPFETRIAALGNTTNTTLDGRPPQQLRKLNLAYGDYQGMTIALLDNKPETLENLFRNLQPQRIVIGVGATVQDATKLAASARQALWAFRIALANHRLIVDFAEMGIHRLLLPGAEGGDPEFEEPVRRLEEATEILGFDGLHTLVGYLDAGGNMRRAARDIAVHVNTLRARIHRITQIINTDLTDPEQRFRLQLAVRLRAGRRAMREDTP